MLSSCARRVSLKCNSHLPNQPGLILSSVTAAASPLLAQVSRVLEAAPDNMRGIHHSSNVYARQDDVDGANQGDETNGKSFAYQTNELHSSATSTSLSHPQAGQAGALSHIDKDGRASMVDVSRFVNTQRTAIASAKVLLGREVFELVDANGIKKGDVLTVAQLAGIMGAKQCATLVPLCHNILISYVNVDLKLEESDHSVQITAEAHAHGPTGVEMEALTAASTAALTIFDMCKAVSRQLVISDLRLDRKTGGKSGTFDRAAGIGV